MSSLAQFLLFSAGLFQANTPSGLLFESRGRNLNISGERRAKIIALAMRLICSYQPLQAVDMFISTSWTGLYVHINLNKLMRLINTYRPLQRISPLVWIDAGRPLDEKEISAVPLPVTIDHPASENMLENPSQIRKQRISILKISTGLLVWREIKWNYTLHSDLKPQCYITQRIVFTSRPLARCWKPTRTYSPYFFL